MQCDSGMVSDPDFWPENRIPGSVPWTKGDFLNSIKWIFKINPLYCFHTFGGRRSMDVLDLENMPESGYRKILTGCGSEALMAGPLKKDLFCGFPYTVLTEDVWRQKYENKRRRLCLILFRGNIKMPKSWKIINILDDFTPFAFFPLPLLLFPFPPPLFWWPLN